MPDSDSKGNSLPSKEGGGVSATYGYFLTSFFNGKYVFVQLYYFRLTIFLKSEFFIANDDKNASSLAVLWLDLSANPWGFEYFVVFMWSFWAVAFISLTNRNQLKFTLDLSGAKLPRNYFSKAYGSMLNLFF
jgi:hypothetical protein